MPTHTHCINKPTDYASLVVSNELLIHSHLIQYLDGCLANSITTVLVSGEFLLLQQKNLSPQISQVVAECRARRPGSDYYYVIVGRFSALKVSKAFSNSIATPGLSMPHPIAFSSYNSDPGQGNVPHDIDL